MGHDISVLGVARSQWQDYSIRKQPRKGFAAKFMTEALDEIFNRFLKALAHSERAPRDELGRYQQNLIEQLARHAHKHVPFYRDRLSCLFTPQGEIDFARWKEVPIVTRSE